MNAAIARCIARLSGDGNVYLGRNGKNGYARYSNTCRELREEFKSDMHKIFGIISLTEGITNTKTPFVQTHRKQIVNFFLKYLASYKSADIFIPEAIKTAQIAIKSEYLKAFYDDEGSPRLRIAKSQEWKRNITLCSKSEKIVTEIKRILEQDFHIKCNKNIHKDIKKDGRISFTVDITGRNNFMTFKQKIGSNHPIKIKRLNLILESYENTYKRNHLGFLKVKNKFLRIKSK